MYTTTHTYTCTTMTFLHSHDHMHPDLSTTFQLHELAHAGGGGALGLVA